MTETAEALARVRRRLRSSEGALVILVDRTDLQLIVSALDEAACPLGDGLAPHTAGGLQKPPSMPPGAIAGHTTDLDVGSTGVSGSSKDTQPKVVSKLGS